MKTILLIGLGRFGRHVAIHLNRLGHQIFVFKNTDSDDAISVVYKRRQGGYGLICDDGLDD